MPLTPPTLLAEPFANSGDRNTIPTAPGSPANAASLDAGFPPITGVAKSSGGLPPRRRDVNGILYEITQHTVFLGKGGWYKADAGILAGAGYAKGAMVLLDDDLNVCVSLVDSNNDDPNTATNLGTSWFPSAGPQCVGLARLCAVTGTANALVLTSPMAPAPVGGGTPIEQRVLFVPGSNNTSTVTLDVDGGGAVALLRNDASALIAGDLIAGVLTEALWNGTDWLLTAPTVQQSSAAIGNFSAVHDVTGNTLGTTYTNSSGKPMWVSLIAATGGSNGDLQGFVDGVAISTESQPNSGSAIGITLMVPPGSTYKIIASVGSIASISKWVEVY